MYWAVIENGDFEIIDGQQRTISLCQYVHGNFSYQDKYFHNLQDNEQKKTFLSINSQFIYAVVQIVKNFGLKL